MIKVELIADSINPNNQRLTTFLCTYPRFIHSEIMTHRQFSRNAASSRAIPTKRIIKQIKDNPAIPEVWGANGRGMQAKQNLSGWRLKLARRLWLTARYPAIWAAKSLHFLGLHKQIANRVLEPWMHITTLITATELINFFRLRAHPDAQPEFQVLAYKMLYAFLISIPQELAWGEWHLPFITEELAVKHSTIEQLCGISVAHCAHTSYNLIGQESTLSNAQKVAKKILGAKHWSPAEHQARAVPTCARSRNFSNGWQQYRQLLEQGSIQPTEQHTQEGHMELATIMETLPQWISVQDIS